MRKRDRSVENEDRFRRVITYSALPGKAVCRIVWTMDGEKNLEYLTRALSGVPEDLQQY